MIVTFFSAFFLLAIIYFFGWLYYKNEARGVTKERKSYTYNQIADNYDLWNNYANYGLTGDAEMTRSEHKKLTIDEKVQILTERFGKEKMN